MIKRHEKPYILTKMNWSLHEEKSIKSNLLVSIRKIDEVE